MADDGGFTNVNVTLGNGKLVSVQVSPELFGHFTSSDPDLNQLAKQLIIQAAMEKDSEAECEELPDIPTVPQTPENSPKPTPSGIFTYEQTIFLISAYKERKEKFLSPTHKKKALWLEITEELNKCFKTEFTVAQVEGRWKTQLSAYKRHQTDQAKSGNERKEFLYEEEFQDIFSDRHDINPKFVVSSLSSSSDSGSFTQDEPCTSSSSGEPAGYAYLCHLPPEIICKILTYIPIPELYHSVSKVCSSMNCLFKSGLVWNSITDLNFFNEGMKDIFTVEFLKLFENCVNLTIDATLLQDCDFLGSFKNLKCLDIRGSKNENICNENIVKNLSKCRSMEKLFISSLPNLSDDGLLSLSKEMGGTLKYLQIRNSAEIRPETFQVLMKNLKCIKAISVTPSGDYEKWAKVLNENAVRCSFGHEILDFVPKRYLVYDRMFYSLLP